jgi:hypothetical protein
MAKKCFMPPLRPGLIYAFGTALFASPALLTGLLFLLVEKE